jgi:Bacteriophage holin of superfamily 6 (Holin_LLH)
MNTDTTLQLVQTLVPLVITVAVPLLIRLWFAVDRNMPANVRHVVESTSAIVAAAIEQKYGSLSGDQKKVQAVSAVKLILDELHINAPESLIDASIEAAVFAFNASKSDSTTYTTAPVPSIPPVTRRASLRDGDV